MFLALLGLLCLPFLAGSLLLAIFAEPPLLHLVYQLGSPFAALAVAGVWAWRRNSEGAPFSTREWITAWLICYWLFVELVGLAIGSPIPFRLGFTPA